MSSLLKLIEESLAVEIWSTESGRTLLLISGVHLKAKKTLKWWAFFLKSVSNLSFINKWRVVGIFLPLNSNFWNFSLK